MLIPFQFILKSSSFPLSILPGAGQAGRQQAGGHPGRPGRPEPDAADGGAAGAAKGRHLGGAGQRGGRHQLREEGRPEGLQNDGRPVEGDRQERAIFPPGRERAVGHLRRHVPVQLSAERADHPAGRRGRQLLRDRHRRGGGESWGAI